MYTHREQGADHLERSYVSDNKWRGSVVAYHSSNEDVDEALNLGRHTSTRGRHDLFRIRGGWEKDGGENFDDAILVQLLAGGSNIRIYTGKGQ